MEHSHDFDPPASNWLARAYYTPVSDALRGHLSARLDVRREIAAARLPQPVSGLIYAVVRRTRLWRGEKIDVARELITHFADGLAAGRTNEQLVEDFGDAKQAAQLIRQAKRRSRPLYWQMWWHVSRSLVVLLIAGLLGYGLLAARFYVANPTIARNYWNEINSARSVPREQQAWPLYREAIVKLGEADSRLIRTNMLAEPDSKDWPRLVAALDRHRESIELTREGARKSSLGFLLGDPADRAVARDANFRWSLVPDGPLADENRSLISALLPHVEVLRDLSRLMAAGARRSAVAGNGQDVVSDLTTILAISQQAFQTRATLVEQINGAALFRSAAETAGRILADHPQSLDEAQLRNLAHALAAYRSGAIQMDFGGERHMFDDLLQRIYTDDGQGRGRLTPDGVGWLREITDNSPPALSLDTDLGRLLSPGFAALVGSRQENRELYQSLVDEMIAAHQGPPWEWDYESTRAPENRLNQVIKSTAGKLRYFPVQLMVPGLGGVFNTGQRTIQERDAVEVAIALVLWHRRHGNWPDRLDQLVPDLLPAVPPDRFDGMPLRYALRDGKPIVYSIGVDRDDDGGRPSDPPDNAIGTFNPFDPKVKDPYQKRALYDGDWILWPPIDEPQETSATE